jgi:hypothetical protein
MFKKTQILTLSLFVLTFSQTSLASWTSCYNKKENKLFFIAIDNASSTLKDAKTTCSSQTFFKGPKNFHLITEVDNANGFANGEPGSEQIMKVKNNRQIMISQWNDLSKSNRILVLEPDFKSNQVKVHCQIENFDDSFSAKVDPSTGLLKVFVLASKNKNTDEVVRLWQKCDINK